MNRRDVLQSFLPLVAAAVAMAKSSVEPPTRKVLALPCMLCVKCEYQMPLNEKNGDGRHTAYCPNPKCSEYRRSVSIPVTEFPSTKLSEYRY